MLNTNILVNIRSNIYMLKSHLNFMELASHLFWQILIIAIKIKPSHLRVLLTFVWRTVRLFSQ